MAGKHKWKYWLFCCRALEMVIGDLRGRRELGRGGGKAGRGEGEDWGKGGE